MGSAQFNLYTPPHPPLCPTPPVPRSNQSNSFPVSPCSSLTPSPLFTQYSACQEHSLRERLGRSFRIIMRNTARADQGFVSRRSTCGTLIASSEVDNLNHLVFSEFARAQCNVSWQVNSNDFLGDVQFCLRSPKTRCHWLPGSNQRTETTGRVIHFSLAIWGSNTFDHTPPMCCRTQMKGEKINCQLKSPPHVCSVDFALAPAVMC